MRNIVKYDATTHNNSIKSGNFNLGVNDTSSNLTGFHNGITPINGGYTIYINKASNGPSIYSPKNDDELIDIVKHLSGTVYSVNDALNWILGQSTMTVVNHNYPNIVTDGLTLNVDASFVSSYPKSNTEWYDLSGNGYDSTLNNGPTFNSDNGGSIVLDGSNDYIDFGSDINISPDNQGWTTEFWVKTDSSGTLQNFMSAESDEFNANWLAIRNGKMAIWNRSPGTWRDGNTTLQSNTIYQVVFICDPGGTTYRFYLNGDIEGGNYSTYSFNSSYSSLSVRYLGRYEFGGSYSRYFNGNFYSSKFYNRALTTEEVQQNYYAGLQRLVPTDGLMISLNPTNTNLYATSTTTAYDISGEGNNGTLLNGVSVTSTNEGSWDFDGSNDYINIPFNSGGMDFSGGQTICMWLKPHTGASNARRNPYNQAYGGSGTITHEMSGTFSYYFGTNGGNSSPYVGRGSSFTVNENELAFIVVSRDQSLGTCKWYKNGVLSTTNTAGGYSSTNNGSSPITIGDGYTSNFVGDIFDVKVYNRGLTDDEVSIIYNSTKTKYE